MHRLLLAALVVGQIPDAGDSERPYAAALRVDVRRSQSPVCLMRLPRRFLSILPTTLAFACGVSRAESARMAPPTNERFPLRHSVSLVSHAETLALRAAADSGGRRQMALRVETSNDGVVGTIDVFSQDSLYQHITAVFDPHSLEPKQVSETRPHWQASLTYPGDRVHGTVVRTSATGSPDTIRVERELAAADLDRRALLHVTPWLPLDEKHAFALRIYDVDLLYTYSVLVKTGGTARIVVPAGTFDAYRVEVISARGMVIPPSLIPTIVYVSADSLRRVLRVEQPDRGVIMELIGWGIL